MVNVNVTNENWTLFMVSREDKDIKIYIRKKEYQDIDIKCLGFIDSFIQKYMKQYYGKSFNGGIDKIDGLTWEEILGDLNAVYETKWKDHGKNYKDLVDRTLPKYEDPLIKAVNEL